MQVRMSKNLARYFKYDDTSCIKTDTSTILVEVSAKINILCFAKDKRFHRVVFSPYSSAMYLYQQKQQQIYNFGFDFSLQELGLTAARLIREVRARLFATWALGARQNMHMQPPSAICAIHGLWTVLAPLRRRHAVVRQ